MEILGVPLLEFVKYILLFSFIQLLWNKRKTILIVVSTFPRDVGLLYTLYCKILLTWMGRKQRNDTLCKSLDKIVQEGGSNRPCFYFGDEIWTYQQLQALSFRVANYFQEKGIKKGDTIGLAMTNRPEYIAIWLGLGRIGAVTVCINTNLRGDFLEKCISVVKCRALIIGTELRDAFQDIWNSDSSGKKSLAYDIYELDRFMENPGWLPTKITTQTGSLPTLDLAHCLLNAGKEPTVVFQGQEPNFTDPVLYLFTSGTTGVPKAVLISHGRLYFITSIASAVKLSLKDVSYSAVPMYHVVGLFGPVWSLCYGTPSVLVVKFSATNFWKDIHRYKATICVYIGEFCRFLCNQPVQPELERSHTLRAMIGGGGLRADVWSGFKTRFGIKKFLDMYASTEGNCTMINLEEKVEACGYIPIWLQPIHPIQLVKTNEFTGEILRDNATGFAIQCDDDEPGELIGKIVNGIPMMRFEGYTEKEATEKKIARNVFKKGDKYFLSGDCLTRDKYGYFYFQDRLGDTFRWKGENVATTMVEGVISKLTGMQNNVVYGVKIPGTEGSACMAAILDVIDREIFIKKLAEGLKQSLPKYAMPMFIRIVNDERGLDMTGTFKIQKMRMKNEGFNIEMMEDPVFVYANLTEYKRLDLETYKEIMRGNHRF